MNSRRLLVTLLALATVAHGAAHAQDARTLSNGKAFAESLGPQSNGQIVNPAAVNLTAWTPGAAAIPGKVPSDLGAFSSPVTASPLYDAAGSQGALSNLGQARIQACQNHVPGGDPIADQECAAVRFMNRDCIPLTNAQRQVAGAAGVATATAASCTGTYGAGQSGFGYQNAVATSDPVFHLSHVAQDNAASLTKENCTSVPVVTKPAQYTSNQCSKTVSTDSHLCTQELAVAVTTNYTPAQPTATCDGGVLQGQYCVSTSSSPATASYDCPDGVPPNGGSCVAQTRVPATPYYACTHGELEGQSCVATTPAEGVPSCPPPQFSYTPADIWTLSHDANNIAWCTHYASDHDDPIGSNAYRAGTSYACPNGGSLSGNTCTTTTTATLNYRCDSGTLSGNACLTGTSTPATVTYTCASGTLSGSQCVTTTSTPATTSYACPGGARPVGDQCVTYSTKVNWIDNCTAYEQSAGSKLGVPK